MFSINDLKEFAKTDTYKISKEQRIKKLREAAKRSELSPSQFVNSLRHAISQIRKTYKYQYSNMEVANMDTLLNVALFNARRCYHTLNANR